MSRTRYSCHLTYNVVSLCGALFSLHNLNFIQFGDTALVWACDKDVPEMVMTLVQAGANPHHITKVNAEILYQ